MSKTKATEWLCKNCQFFESLNREDGRGKCRKNPPIVLSVSEDGESVSIWPIVIGHSDWCHEFKAPN